MHLLQKLKQQVIFLFKLLFIIMLLLLRSEFINLVNLAKYIDILISIDQTKLLKVDLSLLVIVDHIEHELVVFDRQLDARELAASHKFLEAEAVVRVLVDTSEGVAVVAEFLFDSDMDLLQQLLDVLALLGRVGLHDEFGLIEELVLAGFGCRAGVYEPIH